MENTQNQTMEQPKGWAEVQITPELPLAALVQFLNVLNQRLCAIEDNMTIKLQDGQELTLTEIYRLQAEAEQKALEAQAQEQTNESAE